MDFKWEMQERIDAGMNPDEAYYETRDSYAMFSDMKDELGLPNAEKPMCCGPNGCSDMLEVCDCSCETDCECKAVEE